MRLNRFGNSSELKNNSSTAFEGYSTESFKLPTLRAINKSVKYIHNNVDITIYPLLRLET